MKTIQTRRQLTFRDVQRKIIEQKKRERRDQEQRTMPQITPNMRPTIGTCPTKGVKHLKKLKLVPGNFGSRTEERELSEETEEEEME